MGSLSYGVLRNFNINVNVNKYIDGVIGDTIASLISPKTFDKSSTNDQFYAIMPQF